MSGAVENGLYEVGGVGDKNILRGVDRDRDWEGFPFWTLISRGSVRSLGQPSCPRKAVTKHQGSPSNVRRESLGTLTGWFVLLDT